MASSHEQIGIILEEQINEGTKVSATVRPGVECGVAVTGGDDGEDPKVVSFGQTEVSCVNFISGYVLLNGNGGEKTCLDCRLHNATQNGTRKSIEALMGAANLKCALRPMAAARIETLKQEEQLATMQGR
jgi:hypothetical protein